MSNIPLAIWRVCAGDLLYICTDFTILYFLFFSSYFLFFVFLSSLSIPCPSIQSILRLLEHEC